MPKPQLILDIGGVLVTNLSPRFWEELAAAAAVPQANLTSRFKKEIREAVWSGRLTEEAFWTWLGAQAPSVSTDDARELLASSLRPMPAMQRIPEWSRLADIHLLSNHRPEWITPVLRPVTAFLKSVTLSASIGRCKPGVEIYRYAASQPQGEKNLLFVDDQEKNLRQAAHLGWNTLLADSEGLWIDQVVPYLLGS
ncbi:HAD-IA family hydrolase [Paenibacillus sp. P26]|nr:HAD-IA family hydrolase [Paenibacillus sp. P26]